MTRIVVSKYGQIRNEQIGSILELMNESYERLQPHEAELVDVQFFENQSLLRDFFCREKRRYGITDDLDSEFPAIHEAWRGLPRISLSIDRLDQMNDLAAKGTVRHEVGHSILHGSVEYYIFEIPKSLAKLGAKHRLSTECIRSILYLITIAVKDLEVSYLLFGHGYKDDQIAYVMDLLKPSTGDLVSWRLASAHAVGRVLCVSGRLKELLCAIPMMQASSNSRILDDYVISGFSYFLPELSRKMIDVGMELSNAMIGSTHQNVQIAANILCERLFEPILGQHSADRKTT